MNRYQPRISTASAVRVCQCLDVLIRHLADEDVMDTWLAVGIPDGTLEKWPTDEQVKPFLYYAGNIEKFEDKVMTALRLIRHETMKTRSEYVKGAFA